MSKGKTLVIGLGEVGSALAAVLDRVERVLRLDIKPQSFDEKIDVMHLCFPFQSSNDYESTAIGYVNRFRPSITIINSTVLPGTTRRIAYATGAAVAFSPVRGKHARMAEDLLRYVKFVASPDPDSTRRAEEHFRRAGMKTRSMNQAETLELAKLTETSYFGVLIAYAQELNRYCNALNGDYYEAVGFFEEIDFLPGCRYFPGFIGGHCVIPNIHLLLQLAPSPLLSAVLDSNARRARELDGEGGQSTGLAEDATDGHAPKMLGTR